MIKPVIVAGFFTLLGVGCMLAPVGVAAKSGGPHAVAHAPFPSAQNWHHRRTNRFIPYGYSYYPPYPYYDSGESDYAAPPPPKEKPVAETRRECEPKTYSVPSETGAESKVTIVRC